MPEINIYLINCKIAINVHPEMNSRIYMDEPKKEDRLAKGAEY